MDVPVRTSDSKQIEASKSPEAMRNEASSHFLAELTPESGPRPAEKTQSIQQNKTVQEGEKLNAGDPQLPTLILLKQQKDETARVQQVDKVAGDLADYIEGANKSLDIAIYHFQLSGSPDDKTSPMGKVVSALNDKAEQGVKIRLEVFKPEQKGATISDGENGGGGTELSNSLSSKIDVHNDAAATATGLNTNVSGLDLSIQTEGITGAGKLMHSKYIVRDGDTDAASVWTGSTNFTDDAFGSQDNNIIQLKSKDLASVYEKDFQQMWDSGKIANTGKGLHQNMQVGDCGVTVAFSPGDGSFIDSEIASKIEGASDSVHIASMDISSQKILQALSDKIDQGKTVDGIYDGPQMHVVTEAWARSSSPASQEKIALWDKVKDHLVEKHSHPYKPGQQADFMHNKTVDIDNSVVITGSFNFSSNATHNAENIVEVANPQIASQYGAYINDLVQTYGGNSTAQRATA